MCHTNDVKQKNFIQKLLIFILLFVLSTEVFLFQISEVSKVQALNTPVQKELFANFYWYYPWYGAHFKNAEGVWQYTENVNGNIGLQAFFWKPLDPIPYINSHERSFGSSDDSRAKAWFKSSFERAGNAGLTSLAVMARPDLEKWPIALRQMIEVQKELKAEGKKYPKIILHYDGVEYWEKISPNTGQLNSPGPDYDVIWAGTKLTFDTINSLLTPEELPLYFFTYPQSNSFPILIYRIEGNAHDFTSSDWWTNQLRTDFKSTYPDKNIYIILDDLWCNWDYGVNNTVHPRTCNGDNYYHYGGSWEGAVRSIRWVTPMIYSVGPGFNNDHIWPDDVLNPVDREEGEYYKRNLDRAKNLGADWIHIETFNFGEEGSAIDRTIEFGEKYLDLTRTFAQGFVSTPSAALKTGDIDGNGSINIFDFNILVGDFKGSNMRSDLNNDQKVDLFDFNILVSNFGK